MEVAQNATDYAQSKYEAWLRFWYWALSVSDPRVKRWLFMDSVWPTVYFTLAYIILICGLGPKIMEKRKPFDLKLFMIFYNFSMVILSIYMWVNILVGSTRRNYSWVCTPILTYSWEEEEIRIAGALWWFYFSKFIEFTDTLIFVLRKKNSQITFLHVYHHTTMFPLWWIGVKWVAGGQSFLAAMLNSFIHTVMYTYYGLSACGPRVQPYLWWKKYLTGMQLAQFFICLLACVISLYVDCEFPRWMHYALLAYAFSLIILFFNFYIHAYVKGKHSAAEGGASEDGTPKLAPDGKKHN